MTTPSSSQSSSPDASASSVALQPASAATPLCQRCGDEILESPQCASLGPAAGGGGGEQHADARTDRRESRAMLAPHQRADAGDVDVEMDGYTGQVLEAEDAVNAENGGEPGDEDVEGDAVGGMEAGDGLHAERLDKDVVMTVMDQLCKENEILHLKNERLEVQLAELIDRLTFAETRVAMAMGLVTRAA